MASYRRMDRKSLFFTLALPTTTASSGSPKRMGTTRVVW